MPRRRRNGEKDDAVNPLVQDGSKLIPSVTRVFNSGRRFMSISRRTRTTLGAAQVVAGFDSRISDGSAASERERWLAALCVGDVLSGSENGDGNAADGDDAAGRQRAWRGCSVQLPHWA